MPISPILWRVILVLCLTSVASAEALRDAPFGLSWGQSADEVKALGVQISSNQETQWGIAYQAASLPKMIADVETVYLFFGFNDKLWRIVAVSKTFGNDPYGSAAQKRYAELDELLTRKYAGREQQHYQDTRLWSGPDDFLMGIQSGRSWHYTNYKTPAINVQLALGALNSSDAFYRLIFVDTELEKAFQAGQKEREANAL